MILLEILSTPNVNASLITGVFISFQHPLEPSVVLFCIFCNIYAFTVLYFKLCLVYLHFLRARTLLLIGLGALLHVLAHYRHQHFQNVRVLSHMARSEQLFSDRER